MLCSQQFGKQGTPHHITYPNFSQAVDEETEAQDHLLKLPKLQSGRPTVLLMNIQGGGQKQIYGWEYVKQRLSFLYHYVLSIVLFSRLMMVNLLLFTLYCIILFYCLQSSYLAQYLLYMMINKYFFPWMNKSMNE